MPILQLAIKFTEAERALLRKRAKQEGMTEADVLRVSMVMDALVAGEPDAWKILGKDLQVKLAARLWPNVSKAAPNLVAAMVGATKP